MTLYQFSYFHIFLFRGQRTQVHSPPQLFIIFTIDSSSVL